MTRPRKYSDETALKVSKLYELHGSFRIVSNFTGIPLSTCYTLTRRAERELGGVK